MKYYPYTRIFPILHSHVGQFIAFSIQQGLKGLTIQTQVAGLSYINKMMGFGNLTDHFVIKNSYYLVGFVALRPKSTAMVIAGRSVHLTTLFPGQA